MYYMNTFETDGSKSLCSFSIVSDNCSFQNDMSRPAAFLAFTDYHLPLKYAANEFNVLHSSAKQVTYMVSQVPM